MISHFIHANFQIPRYSFLFFFSLSLDHPFSLFHFPKSAASSFGILAQIMSDALINGLAGAGGGIIAQLITYPLQTVTLFTFHLPHIISAMNYTFFFWDVWNEEASVWWSFYLLGKYSATDRERSEEGEEESWDFGTNVSGHPSLSLESNFKFSVDLDLFLNFFPA